MPHSNDQSQSVMLIQHHMVKVSQPVLQSIFLAGIQTYWHGSKHPNILAFQSICWLFQRSALSNYNPMSHIQLGMTTHPDFPVPLMVMSWSCASAICLPGPPPWCAHASQFLSFSLSFSDVFPVSLSVFILSFSLSLFLSLYMSVSPCISHSLVFTPSLFLSPSLFVAFSRSLALSLSFFNLTLFLSSSLSLFLFPFFFACRHLSIRFL